MKNLFRTLILFTTPIPAFAQGEFLQRVSENFEAHTPSGYVKKICQITERGTLITLKNENGKILSTDGPAPIRWESFSEDHRWSSVISLMSKASNAPFTPSVRRRTPPAPAYRMSLDGIKMKILHLHEGVRVVSNESAESRQLIQLMFNNCKDPRESLDRDLK